MLDDFYDKMGNSYYIDDVFMTSKIVKAVLQFLIDNPDWGLYHIDDRVNDEDPEDDTMEHYFVLYNRKEWDIHK